MHDTTNERTISVSSSKPAGVTTPPVLLIARMRPVCNPVCSSSLAPDDHQQVVVRTHRHQDDERKSSENRWGVVQPTPLKIGATGGLAAPRTSRLFTRGVLKF
jgi:hypothetical protein